MSIIHEVENFIRDNQFDEALQLLSEVLNNPAADRLDKKNAALLITEKLLNEVKEKKLKLIWQKIAIFWFEEKEYQKALEAFKRISNKKELDGEIKLKIILTSIRLGHLNEASSALRVYLENLIRKKNSSKTIEIIQSLESENFNLEEFEVYKKIALVYQGLEVDKSSGSLHEDEIIRALGKSKEPELKFLKNRKYIENAFKLGNLQSNKKFISKVFESYLLGSKFEEHIPALIEYVLIVKRREIAYLILRRSTELEFIKKNYKKKLEQISKKLEEYHPFKFNSEDLDLGEDLFSTEFPASKRRDIRIERLKNQYEILLENGYMDQARDVLAQLNEIDPDNKIIEENVHTNEKSRLKKNKQLNNTKIANLLDEVELMSTVYGERKSIKEPLEHQIRVMKKHIESFSDQVMETSGKDILISLMSMDLYEIALALIKSRGMIFIKDPVEYIYLQSICYFKMNKTLLAIEKIDEALLQEMNKLQRCSILYQKAEMLNAIGRVRESLLIYRQILKIDPKHKQANQKALQIV